MKRILIVCLFLYSAIFHMGAFAKPTQQPLDKMVAIVNDDVISRSELNHALDTAKMQIAQEHTLTPPKEVLQKQVLDQLINKKIQLQIAQQAGIQITDAEMNLTIGRIAKQNNMTVSSLYEHINQDGMGTEEYRQEMRDQMTLHKLQQQEVASKMTITPQEVTNFMHSRAWQTNGAKEYHLQDMLIPLSDKPSNEEMESAKTHASEIMAKLNQGQDFDQVTLSETEAHKSFQGGDLGWRKLPEIPSAFATHVIHMQAKSTAGPIQTPNGFHIIRLVEARALNAQQAATSKKMIESLLLQQKFEEAVQNWVSKLRSQAFIVVNV
jgi:peptidyl-prolyl cis-trans isomerase SurA